VVGEDAAFKHRREQGVALRRSDVGEGTRRGLPRRETDPGEQIAGRGALELDRQGEDLVGEDVERAAARANRLDVAAAVQLEEGGGLQRGGDRWSRGRCSWR
jgi:hypothetical protein